MTNKESVFGILCHSGKVFVQLVNDTQAKDLLLIINKKVKSGLKISFDTYRSYT